MHEFGLAQGALEAALEAAGKRRARRITQVTMRFGALSAVVPEAFEFSFEALAEGTPAQGCKLVMETVPPVCYCPTCAKEFTAELYAYACPRCGSLATELRGGREADLVSIEVD